MGQTETHWASSWKPTHSVHLAGSITKLAPFSEIASLGHSGSHAEQEVQFFATIMYAISLPFLLTADAVDLELLFAD